MKVKVKRIVDEIVSVLINYAGVRAVVLQHFIEKDVYDPNFSVTLDVFRDGDIPSVEERQASFPQAQYFESSRLKTKDRFMLSDLPVRISYKDCARVDAVLNATQGVHWLSMERGTYLFHRIATGTAIWVRDKWMDTVLAKLDQLPESFWALWIESCHRRSAHFLSNMGAAAMKEDNLYFILSLAGFLRAIADLLFAVNHVFEPGPRDYASSLALLEECPDSFNAHWFSLLRDDAELPPERKHEIADHLARAVFSLTP